MKVNRFNENLKTYLKEKIQEWLDEGEEISDVHGELFSEYTVENWPTVKDDDGDDEGIDIENFEWVDISDDSVTFNCGGDWQTPMSITVELVDGKLKVTNAKEIGSFRPGVDDYEVAEAFDIELDY